MSVHLEKLRPRIIYFVSYDEILSSIKCKDNRSILELHNHKEENTLRLSIERPVTPLKSRSPIPLEQIIEGHRIIENNKKFSRYKKYNNKW